MTLRRGFIAIVVLVAVVIAATFAWRRAECAGFGRSAPVVQRWTGEGPLLAGAARVQFVLPPTAVPAGYGPLRKEAKAQGAPLFARALVLRSGKLTVALVSLDLLLVPESLAAEIQARARARGLQAVMVAATHSHTSVGGFDDRLVPEIAAIGKFRPEIRRALIDAADQSVSEALSRLASAGVWSRDDNLGNLVRSRDRGEIPDSRAWALLVGGAGTPVAELLLVSAHPTLVPRKPAQLAPDYPGVVASGSEGHDAIASMVLQSAVGNASAQLPAGSAPADKRFAEALVRKLNPFSKSPSVVSSLALTTVTMSLPQPDTSRLAPAGLRPAADALLCATAPRKFELTELRIGNLALLGVPGEPTAEVAQALEAASGARVVALTNGYLGYLETPQHVRAGDGESKRQYFGPELYDVLVEAARATR